MAAVKANPAIVGGQGAFWDCRVEGTRRWGFFIAFRMTLQSKDKVKDEGKVKGPTLPLKARQG